MEIFFKCSFRSSHGFCVGKYDTDNMLLNYISEKNNNSNNLIPETIEYTLSHQLGRCLILATDENGHYFFGVYRLIEGNDDKYVNAVFYAPDDPQSILNLYDYFCNNQQIASSMLIKSVTRTNDTTYTISTLEYSIENNIISDLISNSNNNSTPKIKKYKSYPPNALLAFITADEYDDYQITLEEKFNTKKMFLSEHFDTHLNTIINYQLAKKYIYKLYFPNQNSLPIRVSIGILGVIAVTIIILLL